MKLFTKYIFQVLILSIVFMSTQALVAQDISQTIRGKVLNKDNQSGLIGVTVVLLNEAEQIGTVSDLNGDFRLENIPVGRHQLQFSYVGFIISYYNYSLIKRKSRDFPDKLVNEVEIS